MATKRLDITLAQMNWKPALPKLTEWPICDFCSSPLESSASPADVRRMFNGCLICDSCQRLAR